MTYFRFPLLALAAFILAAPFQASAAGGLQVTDVRVMTTPADAHLTITLVRKPSCHLRASRTTIRSGEATRFSWDSEDAEYLVGAVKGRTYPLKGSENIAIGFPGTYRLDLFFVGKGGVTTCSKEVRVLPKKSSHGA